MFDVNNSLMPALHDGIFDKLATDLFDHENEMYPGFVLDKDVYKMELNVKNSKSCEFSVEVTDEKYLNVSYSSKTDHGSRSYQLVEMLPSGSNPETVKAKVSGESLIITVNKR